MCGHHPLDLVRVHIETRHQDHVLLPVDDLDEATFVHHADVASGEPPLRIDHLVRLVLAVPVTRHHLRAADADLARHADAHGVAGVVAQDQFGGRDRQSDRPVERREIEWIDRRRGRGLGEPVGLDQRHAGDLGPLLGHRFLHRHAAAQRQLQRGEVELAERLVVHQRIEQRVHAGKGGELVFGHLLDEAGDVARIGDEDIFGAQRHEHEAVRCQRENMIERQRGDDDLAALRVQGGPYPCTRLQHVGDDVAVEQHRALGHPRGAPRVLQERNVLVAQRHALERASLPGGNGIGEADRTRQRVGGHHLLHVPQHEIDEDALEAQQLADRRHHDVLHLGLADHGGHGIREILDADQNLGAGVTQLMLELARRIQRIDVDHGAPHSQRAEQCHRVLQDVGHHQRNARALHAPEALQPCAERAGLRIELGKGQRLAHARERGPRGELAHALLEDVAHRRILVDVDFRGNTLRILLEPDFFHDAPP